MDKLVCESLQEYRSISEARDGEKNHGPIRGVYKTVKSAPGRALRRKRARSIIGKYKTKIVGKLQKIIDKYNENIKQLLEKTESAIESIDTDVSKEIQSRQREDILDDMVEIYKSILVGMKQGMEEQLKTYAESFSARLERAGTITGSEFTPEDKTALMSEWKIAESEINKEIQSKLIDLIDNPFINKFHEIKATLKDYINKNLQMSNVYGYGTKEEPSDPDFLHHDSMEYRLYQWLIRQKTLGNINIELDKVFIIDISMWNKANKEDKIGHAPGSNRIKFKIDNKTNKIGYAFYDLNKEKGITIRSRKSPSIYPLIRGGEQYVDGETRAGLIIGAITG